MMDLIDRMAAIEEVDDIVASVSVCATIEQARGATWAKGRIRERLEEMPTVPAAPLDKLCEWLATWYEPQYNREDLDNMKFPMEHEQQKKIWERVLTGLMEEWEGQHDGGIGCG